MMRALAGLVPISVWDGARMLRTRGAHAAATAVCALLWAVLAVLQGTASTVHGGSTRSAQPLALTVATAVLVLLVSVTLWLAAFGTPEPAVGFVLTGLAVAVPLLLIVALRTGLWSRLGAGVGASVATLLGAR
ncbi:hypothetical protein [Kineococcus rhizosphaerae]|nr:hypothetical protein [Kineococcus rhizosphaerae]